MTETEILRNAVLLAVVSIDCERNGLTPDGNVRERLVFALKEADRVAAQASPPTGGRCNGSYQLDKPFEATYRCALEIGHNGPHGNGIEASPPTPDAEKYQSFYSGDVSRPFWRWVKTLPPRKQDFAYSLGCEIQEIETKIANLMLASSFSDTGETPK